MLITRSCAACNRPFHGRMDRKTCSDACRQRLRRAQAVTEAVTALVRPVTPAWRDEDALADPFEHWHPISGGPDHAD